MTISERYLFRPATTDLRGQERPIVCVVTWRGPRTVRGSPLLREVEVRAVGLGGDLPYERKVPVVVFIYLRVEVDINSDDSKRRRMGNSEKVRFVRIKRHGRPKSCKRQHRGEDQCKKQNRVIFKPKTSCESRSLTRPGGVLSSPDIEGSKTYKLKVITRRPKSQNYRRTVDPSFI